LELREVDVEVCAGPVIKARLCIREQDIAEPLERFIRPGRVPELSGIADSLFLYIEDRTDRFPLGGERTVRGVTRASSRTVDVDGSGPIRTKLTRVGSSFNMNSHQ
jgi:hypothetical protein